MTDLLVRPGELGGLDEIDLREEPRPASPPAPVAGTVPVVARPAVVLGAALAGAGAIHLALAPSHLAESSTLGAGFVLAGWTQLALAGVVVRKARSWSLVAAFASSIVFLAVWAVSRTAGLPVAGHDGAEPFGLVDGVCVGLEVAAVVLAVVAALRPRRVSFGRSVVGVTAAVLATSVAIASPAARDHADGHGHGEAVDDLGFGALQNGQMGHDHGAAGTAAPTIADLDPATSGELAAQLALTAPLVQQFPTIAAAKAAGYRQAGPFSPGLGIHYSRFEGSVFNSDGDMDPEDIASPFLIFDGPGEDAQLAGFMYMAYQDTPPEGFAGPLDLWHFHTNTCIRMGPEGIETPFGADLTDVTREMCEAAGGSLIDFTGYMVHVWTVPGYDSPLGTFSDLNPRITCPDGTYHTIPTAEIGGRDSTCVNP